MSCVNEPKRKEDLNIVAEAAVAGGGFWQFVNISKIKMRESVTTVNA